MDTQMLLHRFAEAVQTRDGKGFAALFTEDAVYHDVFYGAFHGRQKIAELVDDWFYRTAEEFR
ncbi:nuclear transport factor 2 family protein, partial [Ferrovibrio terrae]|uniref:nuclear transport factor 2 family protein n=1 Tax=Ferrovibrio terrae TaxID=2594003 RepID=UPI0031378A73